MPIDRQALDSLARRVTAGDGEAVDALARAGYELVDYVITRRQLFLPRREGDRGDLIQEGMQGFWEAVLAWQPGRQQFYDFAVTCVYRELVGVLVRIHRPIRRSQLYASSLNAYTLRNRGDTDDDGSNIVDAFPFPDPSGLGIDPAEAIVEQEVPILLAVLSEHMSDLEQEVVLRFIVRGQSYGTIAAALGINRKAVDNALQRARRKILKRLRQIAADPRLSDGMGDMLRFAAGERRGGAA